VIADAELRAIFKIEFEENIQTLNSELLKLEADVFDKDARSKLMRVAHSMKGGARMIGLTGVVTLAHFFEDMLGAVNKENIALKKADFDRMYKALDVIKSLVNEAVTGDPLNFDPDKVTDSILNPGEDEAPDQSPEESATEVELNDISTESTSVPDQMPETNLDTTPVESVKSFAIDTIRVAASKLDTLMNLSGELTVSKIQLALRLGKIDNLGSLIEESIRDLRSIELMLAPLKKESKLAHTDIIGTINKLRNRFDSAAAEMGGFREGLSEDNSRLNFVSYEFEEVIKNLRMLQLSNIFNLYPRMVRDIASELKKEVIFTIEGAGITADKKILEEMRDPLMHMIRNSLDHGIELPEEREKAGKPRVASIKLTALHSATTISIILEDDGKGLNEESILETAIRKKLISKEESENLTPSQIHKLIFTPGFSTSKMITDVSGRGVGMEVVQANVSKLKGRINIDSEKGKGTKFIIDLPLTLATLRVMTVGVNGSNFAIPIDYIDTSILVEKSDIFSMEGRDTIVFQGEPVSIVALSSLLEINSEKINDAKTTQTSWQCIIISSMGEKAGFIVDYLIDEQEVLVKPLGVMLKKVRNVSGSTILGSGDVCIILNPNDLVRSVKTKGFTFLETSFTDTTYISKKRILLVEDSITTRTQEKRILEGAGYEVVVAVDGLDGYEKLNANEIDAVVSDVEMPNMDGLSLAEKIRQNKKYATLPIILVTSLSTDEQKKRGLESGANAYLTKSGFDQKVLIETIARLV